MQGRCKGDQEEAERYGERRAFEPLDAREEGLHSLVTATHSTAVCIQSEAIGGQRCPSEIIGSWRPSAAIPLAALTAGLKSAPASSPPPRSRFASDAPLESASAMSSSRYLPRIGTDTALMWAVTQNTTPA